MRLLHSSIEGFTRAIIVGVGMIAFGLVATVASAGPGMPKTDIRLSQPKALKTGENTFEVIVKGANGKPVNNADVSIVLVMPKTASMAEMRNDVTLTSSGAGKYVGSGQVVMAGTWRVTVGVKQGGKEIGQKRVKIAAQ